VLRPATAANTTTIRHMPPAKSKPMIKSSKRVMRGAIS
jgi:hypothetical protein